MRKGSAKRKSAQGCMKISSFFTSQSDLSSTPVLLSEPDDSPVAAKQKIEYIEEKSISLLQGKTEKRKQGAPSSMSPPKKKIDVKSTPSPQPSMNGITINSTIVFSAKMLPSTSGGTPLKNRSLISVKTPEKLLNSKALDQLLSPVQDRRDISHSSPVRNTKTASSSWKSSGNKSSPEKARRTPKKLFERSPKNLNEFNVEVLKNFVTLTPTKKEINIEGEATQIQELNEKTPVKNTLSDSLILSTSKVKTRLDFSSSRPSSSTNSSTIIMSQKENHDTSNIDLDVFEDSWDADCIDQINYNLDLSTSQHCKIVALTHRTNEIIITIKSTFSEEQAICSLQGFWLHCKLCINDTVRLIAIKYEGNWLINNNFGYIVFEPDLLISTTSVVGSVFCKRLAVFKEKFHGFDPTNKFMIIGKMVHSLLQEVLKCKLYDIKDVKRCALNILNKPEYVRQIYETGESIGFISEEFLNYVPKVADFVNVYVSQKNNVKTYKNDNWKGTITAIEDIEENIWCPDLGIKGKVDISVKSGLTLMPLEVKTGRASVSLEHRGQVLLYIMMMSKLGYQVSSGLLLYLKEGILKEIPASEIEKRDLILLRNELTYYLSKVPKVVSLKEGKYLEPPEVPEVIDHPSCSRCSYSAVCMAYSKFSNEDIESKMSLRQVHNNLSRFITSAHIDYFMHWVSLLSLEMPNRSGIKDLRTIYTMSPEERKSKGKCLINLSISQICEQSENGIFLTTFSSENSAIHDNFLLSGLTTNSYVVISVRTRPAVASGFISNISLDSISVSLDRNLNSKFKKETFFIDSYDSTIFLTFNLSSLALILDTTEYSNQLRSIVIDKQPTTFQPKLPKVLADKAKPILKRLNRVQQRAVLKAIAANEYFLIKGMPGTGKTATIVALIQVLLELNQSVLITSHTHSAVDTVCLKLITFGVKFMRLGSEAKMNVQIRNYSENFLTKDCHSAEALAAVYNNVQVMAVTCLGSSHAALSKRMMDVCIVDESTQVLQCSVFRPLHSCKKFILIGDPDQLPAIVRDKTAIELGMTESLFERLDSEECRVSLNLNYRMNESITALANALTYNGELEIGAERIAQATVNIPRFVLITKSCPNWIVRALSPKLENAVQFVDTGPVWNLTNTVSWALAENLSEENHSMNNQNIYEAAIIHSLVSSLVKQGKVPPEQIGVIATYNVQVSLLSHLLKLSDVDVNTVDQFQGKDKEIIIYSCSKSKDLRTEWIDNKFDLTEDKRRLNVAITRAKHKLIIVGDLQTLQKYSTFKKIKDILEKNVIRLREDERFEWESLLDLKPLV
ncbi:DNA replication ATP-dependent helicase/nuclease DNA2 [Euwallacea fornicatus]|uniref:DNA replication ATP-dependent helicase/nuclease DNA2 n=1 Tax=Euwallacea fornicatus TaxID=995702 RepID=UPI00338F0AF7